MHLAVVLIMPYREMYEILLFSLFHSSSSGCILHFGIFLSPSRLPLKFICAHILLNTKSGDGGVCTCVC